MSMVPTVGWKTVPAYSIAKDEPDYYLGMGLTAECVANEYNVSRADQDAFALASHQKAKNAIDNGFFKKGILPIEVTETYINEKNKKATRSFIVDTDDGVRADTTLEALAKLKPAFKKDGTVTAGNSSGINDGAAAMLIANEEAVKQFGLTPMAKVIGMAVAGVDRRALPGLAASRR